MTGQQGRQPVCRVDATYLGVQLSTNAFYHSQKGLSSLIFFRIQIFQKFLCCDCIFRIQFSPCVKSMVLLPRPMISFPSKTCAWHCKQFGATTGSPLGACTTV